jgi:hypothetical protein
MNIRVLALGLLLAASPAFAADLDGKWTGSIDAGNGPVEVNYAFKADGTTLTGNPITFSLDLDFGQGPTTFKHTGVVSPAEIKLHTEFMGMPFDFTVKKAT